MDALKVLFVASSFPRYPEDTASVFLLHLARSLAHCDCQVRVVAPDASGDSSSNVDGISVVRFRYFPKRFQTLAYGSGILSNIREQRWRVAQIPAFLTGMFLALRREVLTFRPDIVHAHWLLPQGLVAASLRAKCSGRLVVTAHGGDAFALNSPVLRGLKHRVLRHCDAWTSNTLATADAVIGPGRHTALPSPVIIPMGVDFNTFSGGDRSATRTALGIDEETRIALFVGRLVEKKGVDDLLRAFAQIANSDGAAHKLWVIGDGLERPALERLALQLGAADHIRFFGTLPNSTLPDYLAAADLFVGPSVVAKSGDTEGMGVVFIEAFSAGLCVLATDAGGIREIVEDGVTGRLVAPRRVDQLASVMKELLADDVQRATLASNAQRRAQARYDWSKVAANFRQCYLDAGKARHHWRYT
jgi:glycosyltransferase involved in cell wall biosynthesis